MEWFARAKSEIDGRSDFSKKSMEWERTPLIGEEWGGDCWLRSGVLQLDLEALVPSLLKLD